MSRATHALLLCRTTTAVFLTRCVVVHPHQNGSRVFMRKKRKKKRNSADTFSHNIPPTTTNLYTMWRAKTSAREYTSQSYRLVPPPPTGKKAVRGSLFSHALPTYLAKQPPPVFSSFNAKRREEEKKRKEKERKSARLRYQTGCKNEFRGEGIISQLMMMILTRYDIYI